MATNFIFDYIIVGTGPAGAVLAKTLSDDKKTSVLVLESGENNDKDKPIRDSTIIGGAVPRIDAAIVVTQEPATGISNRVQAARRGAAHRANGFI